MFKCEPKLCASTCQLLITNIGKISSN